MRKYKPADKRSGCLPQKIIISRIGTSLSSNNTQNVNKLSTINLTVKIMVNLHQSFLFNFDELRNDIRIDPILNQIKEKEMTSIIESDSHCNLKR